MISVHTRIYLLEDLPGTPFVKGDVGTVVLVYPNSEVFEVEFFQWKVLL